MRRQQLAWCFAIGLAAAALAGPTRHATACGPCICDTEPRGLLTLIRGVPLNLLMPVPVADPAEDPPQLVRVSDGMPVPATVELDESGRVWWLKVDEDLQPSTEYRTTGAQFTTGSARDEEAPTLSEVSSSPGGNGALCDVQLGAQLTLSGAADAGDHFAVWLEVELELGSSVQRLYLDYSSGSIPLGQSQMGCFGATELSGTAPGEIYPGRARLHDAAGNVSDWRTFALELAEEEPGGCGTPVSNAGAAGMAPTTPDTGTAGTSNQAPNGAAAASSDADGARTSKGCGCVLGARARSEGGAGAALVLALLFARRKLSLPRARKQR